MSLPSDTFGRMLIDCDMCLAKDDGICNECVVSFILPMTQEVPGRISLEDEEVAALEALAEEGLLPPLRLISPPGERPRSHREGDLAG